MSKLVLRIIPLFFFLSISSQEYPTADAQTVNATEDVPITILLTGSGVTGDSNISFIIMDLPNNGTLNDNGNQVNSSNTQISSNEIIYTALSENATSDSFEIRTKTDGGLLSEVVKVTINITLVNDKPIATAQTVEAVEQTAKTITLAGTDAEGQDITCRSLRRGSVNYIRSVGGFWQIICCY